MYTFSPSTWEEGRGRQLSEISEAGLQNKFQDSHGFTVKPCLKKTKQPKKEVRIRVWAVVIDLTMFFEVKDSNFGLKIAVDPCKKE